MVHRAYSLRRAALASALPRRSFAALAALGLVLSLGAGPVAAETLVGTSEGYDGTSITPPVGGLSGEITLFQDTVPPGYTYRATVVFRESALNETTYGWYALHWICGGSLVGGSIAGRLSSSLGRAYLTVQNDAAGGAVRCALYINVDAPTIVDQVTVQIYTGVTSSEGVVIGPVPSPSPSPLPSGAPSPVICFVPMPSGYIGPPAPTACPSPGPDYGQWPVSVSYGTTVSGLYPVGLPVHWFLNPNVDAVLTYQATGDGAYPRGATNGIVITGRWLPAREGSPYNSATVVPNVSLGGGSGTIAQLLLRVHPGSVGNTSAWTGWAVEYLGQVTSISWGSNYGPVIFTGASCTQGGAPCATENFWVGDGAPSPSPGSLGECFYPLPTGYLGPPAPRVCGPGESPGTTSLGQCFYRVPTGTYGPPAPRVCDVGEPPGSFGNGQNDPWVNNGSSGGGGWDARRSNNWPLSGTSCTGNGTDGSMGGKAGFTQYASAYVGPLAMQNVLDVGAIAVWIGDNIHAAVVSLDNSTRWVMNMFVDLVVPCPTIIDRMLSDAMGGDLAHGLFGTQGDLVASVSGAVGGGPDVPFSTFTVMGKQITLPLMEIANAAAPVRPFLVPVVVLGVALRLLTMLAHAFRAPSPNGGGPAGP
jgi:hypothetical protein